MNKRWSTYIPEDISPLGDEQFAAIAVEILWHSGPPEMVTTLDGETVKPSKELARRYVVQLAEKFRMDSFLTKNAPRIGSVVKQLLDIQNHVKDFHLALRESDDFTRIVFQIGCVKIEDGGPVSPLIKQSNAAGLPLPGKIGASGEPSEWERVLGALDVFLGHCLRQCSRPDKGGATNAYKSMWGSPASALVETAWYVFDMFRPGKATGSGDGPFQAFVEAVAEYATGEEGKVSLDQAVKNWAKELRESKHETATLRRLKLERSLPTTSPERLEEIRREEDAIVFRGFLGNPDDLADTSLLGTEPTQ